MATFLIKLLPLASRVKYSSSIQLPFLLFLNSDTQQILKKYFVMLLTGFLIVYDRFTAIITFTVQCVTIPTKNACFSSFFLFSHSWFCYAPITWMTTLFCVSFPTNYAHTKRIQQISSAFQPLFMFLLCLVRICAFFVSSLNSALQTRLISIISPIYPAIYTSMHCYQCSNVISHNHITTL